MDYSLIIEKAWQVYDSSKSIAEIEDISAKVSTNHVFRVCFTDGDLIIAKLSYYGKYEHFKEDHNIIHVLSNNLLYPFENFLAKSLLKNNKVYTYRYKNGGTDAWVVFYNPVRVRQRFPRRLDEGQIRKFAQQTARFHKACSRVRNVLPRSSKTLATDIVTLLHLLETKRTSIENNEQRAYLKHHCYIFLRNYNKFCSSGFEVMPVFIDWNIGNFSVTEKMEFYTRWDYDWFRMSTRMLDFYFFSRVVSDAGDRTIFSYTVGPMMEDRFFLFLQEYHQINQLKVQEVDFLKEVYRFFILNYVIKDGNYFFNNQYAPKLQSEALEIYLPSLETDFNAEKLIEALRV